jgi:hypothetical protein
VNTEMVKTQINKIKKRRRYIDIYADDVLLQKLERIQFDSHSEYDSKVITVASNLHDLKLCSKSGSWVKIGTSKRFIFFWTSRYLNYFLGLPKIKYTRNFGAGIIRSAHFCLMQQVKIDSFQVANSLNIYSHKISSNSGHSVLNEAFYLCVNGANSFQHFVQDLLPILSLAKEFLNTHSWMEIILNKPNEKFADFDSYFELLGISNPKIFIQDGNLTVKNLYIVNFNPLNAVYCLPKDLYANAHKSISMQMSDSKVQRRSLVLFHRQEATRNFHDYKLVQQELEYRALEHGLDLIVLNPSLLNLIEIMHEIKRSKYIFGVHGGAMYHMIFAPVDTTVIEFVTIKDTDSLLHLANSFGLRYLPFALNGGKGSSNLKVTKASIDSIFESILTSKESY